MYGVNGKWREIKKFENISFTKEFCPPLKDKKIIVLIL